MIKIGQIYRFTVPLDEKRKDWKVINIVDMNKINNMIYSEKSRYIITLMDIQDNSYRGNYYPHHLEELINNKKIFLVKPIHRLRFIDV